MRLVPALMYVVAERLHEEGDRTEHCWRMPEFIVCAGLACKYSIVSPCQIGGLATSSDHLPCTIIMIITDKHPAGSSKTGAGVEAEDTQDRKSIHTPELSASH